LTLSWLADNAIFIFQFINNNCPLQVGFNAGNGTKAYEYKPYSQDMRIRDLTYKGYANQIPGRHVFRIDERVISGNCFDDESMITIILNILICD
jgi:hypothetical protein